ncbi:alpha/beta fold hydrolase [Tianweitania sediminis]|uniref:Alpha/beta fold hydrolase n=1 Tax=Tianweitania sediminis TaxID=1502156 RepID=A0A8J7R0I0_9HYPH|nr:alpha/beta fold hydrolase [Tianweitania sediminis]MBP0440258.1 alpha/beta fold hydrolase [Tianweitania sediminis]
MKRTLVVLAVAAAVLSIVPARADAPLKGFKDSLFAYPQILQRSDDGAHITVDYQEMRDINGRDAVPERRVKSDYIATGVRAQQRDLVLNGPDGTKITHFAVGKRDDARLIVIYLHGQGGSRKQGVDDLTFGGNFNRIKNLAVANNGLYLVPDFPGFGDTGAAHVAALIRHYSATSPGAPVFVACGSMGGALCWNLAQNPEVAPLLGGLLLLGSHWDDAFLGSAAFKAKVPLFFGHGSRDRVFPVEKQEAFFRSIRNAQPGYPARFVRFESGSHGTPIRMVDWRETLNWMLSLR